jgi:hypothetical protein
MLRLKGSGLYGRLLRFGFRRGGLVALGGFVAGRRSAVGLALGFLGLFQFLLLLALAFFE